MARLITAKMAAMLAYKPGDVCPLDGEPMFGRHAGQEDLAKVSGVWRVIHRRHHAGIFPRPEPDPALWPLW